MTKMLLRSLLFSIACRPVFAADALTPMHAGFDLTASSEVVATVVGKCEACDWGVPGRETVLLELRLDGAYSQHLAMTRGPELAAYRVLLGAVGPGHHELLVTQDQMRSARAAEIALVDRIEFEAVASGSLDYEMLARAPVLRARPGTVERFSDFPLLMYAERNAGTEGPAPYALQYTVIFTNEDGGTPPDRLMATWGRTTDIEFVYGVTRPRRGASAREVIQVEGHRWVDFGGRRAFGHPELWIATDNNMVADHGPEEMIRFAPAPVLVSLDGSSRERVMDDYPWTYRLTSLEMLRERRVTPGPPDGAGRMADPRRYVVVEACGRVEGAGIVLDVGVRQRDGAIGWFSSDLGLPAFQIARSGCFRGAAPVPEGVVAGLDALRVRAVARTGSPARARAVLTQVNLALTLGATFQPVITKINWLGAATLDAGSEGYEVPLAR
jgi:hypothetical protein